MKIGFLDSGLGGISVLKKCREKMPSHDYIYYADDGNAPYGNLPFADIESHVNRAVDKLLEKEISALVVACNTATSVCINKLRQRIGIPIIGIEPALAPAVRDNPQGKIILLCTNATAKLDKLNSLILKLHCERIVVLPQSDLAMLVENNIGRLENITDYIVSLLTPYEDASAVVLGCTHYCFIKDIISDNFKFNIYDGNSGVANMLKNTVSGGGNSGNGSVELILSSGNAVKKEIYRSLL